ncbi:MAG: electron transfer flavoprotein subunit alpha/FixB family protein [Desulfuromonadales bacterium]|nr:electron transfer flavoprotein subunit alpha/FixB family protein [Desulfuromonadales bacterium]
MAARLRIGFAAGCDRLQREGGSLLQTYLAYDNKVHLTVAYGSRPQMATVRPEAMKVRQIQNARPPAVVRVDPAGYVAPADRRLRVVGVVKADPKTADITDAEIIVAGGRGIGETDFPLLTELAELLGAAVAGSRMAVDAGWTGRERQIGQSGKTVSPDLLISCGISGASAHTIGMRDARTVIAINSDKSAPMVRMADLGVVGDFHAVAPALIERLRQFVQRPEERPLAQEAGR